MTLEEHITIEEILAEANAHGLKAEVQEWANKFLKHGFSRVGQVNFPNS